MSRYVDLNGNTWDGTPITSKIQEVKTRSGYMSGITTGWLWCDSVPHIDLEEHDKQIMVDTIDEFYNRLLDNKNEINASNYPWNYIELVARKMTEKLKEQNNERT